MRLSEIRKIILENIDNLSITHSSPNNNQVTIQNITKTVNALENLSQLTFLSKRIDGLRNMEEIYTARTSTILVAYSDFDVFNRRLTEFRTQCETIIDLAASTISPMNENTICVKLVETSNISDVKKLLLNLDEAFSQISNLTNYKGSAKFAGFESGTNWIYLVIDGSKYVALVYLLIRCAYQIALDYNNYKLLQQRYQGAFIQNQSDEAIKDVISSMASRLTKEIDDSEKLEFVQDEINRFTHATTKLANILVEGNKVVASLTAPPEQQSKLAQSAKQISSQLNELKLLTSPENTSEQVPINDEPTN